MQSALEIAEDQARRRQCTAIHRIRLRVGLLSGVVPDALAFAFDVLKSETAAAEARLEIETVPAVSFCDACRVEFETEEIGFVCPHCGEISTNLLRGQELDVIEVEAS